MMNQIKSSLPLMMTLFIVFASCQSKQKLNEDSTTSILKFEEKEDCYTPRKVILTIEEAFVVVKKYGDEWVYESGDGQKRFLPCEVPEHLKKEDLQLIISGTTLEIFIGERWIGTPFRASTIQLSSNQ